jgi:hypothetical protein
MQVQDTDPLAPSPDSGGNTTPQGYQGSDLTSGWNAWINKPNNRAALAQFGIAMLQPMGMGETGVGHFANAVGAAGEAHRHVTTQEQQDERSRTEAELRESRARAAETSANAAETRAYYSGENSRLRAENANTSNFAKNLQAQSAARARYDKYVTDPLREGDPLPYDQWIRSPEGVTALTEEHAKLGLGVGAGTTAPSVTPGASGPTAAPSRTEAVLGHPTIQSQRAVIQEAARSNDANKRRMAKEYVDTKLAPYIDPSDLPKVYQLYGIH